MLKFYSLRGLMSSDTEFASIVLKGIGFKPHTVPLDRLRCRVLFNNRLVLVFIADTTDWETAFVCVLAPMTGGREMVRFALKALLTTNNLNRYSGSNKRWCTVLRRCLVIQ